MASRQEVPARPAPRLYLVTDPVDDAEGCSRALGSAMLAADVAVVLVRFAPGSPAAMVERVRALAPAVQGRGAALLVADANLALAADADGAHLTGIDALNAAVAKLKPDRIAGAGGLRTRHDAMLAGEAGADYVMFGEPDAAGVRPAFAAVLERVTWWSELFEIPCVGYAAAPEEVASLCEAGADFVALGDFVWKDARGPAAAVASAAEGLHAREFV